MWICQENEKCPGDKKKQLALRISGFASFQIIWPSGFKRREFFVEVILDCKLSEVRHIQNPFIEIGPWVTTGV
jgi:hypothetical protein